MLGLGPAVRVGVARDVDVGVRSTLLYVDVKYQFQRDPQDSAFDLGVSYLPEIDGGDSPDRYKDFGLYPMAPFSAAHYFYGVRVVYVRQVEENRVSNYLMPGHCRAVSRQAASLHTGSRPLLRCGPDPENKPFAFGLGFGLEYKFGER